MRRFLPNVAFCFYNLCMKITNKITNKVMKAATDAAAKVAVSNVNSACSFMLHQPKVPALPKRFQK